MGDTKIDKTSINKNMSGKQKVILQKTLWPQVGVCSENELFYRLKGKCLFDGESLLFKEGGAVSSDTYFNSVSIDKWKKYTVVESLGVRIKLKGKFRLSLRTVERVMDNVIERDLFDKIITADGDEIELSFSEDIHGMAYFYLVALEESCEFYGAEYFTEVKESDIRTVKIAIDICTYKREEFVYKNLEILRKYLIENDNSVLKGRLEVFVADNGKTLDPAKITCDKIHIFPNKNAGGTSGFTRGMIEVLKANENGDDFTHVLLMDDDVIIEPESIERTYRILSLLKDKYIDAVIGGAMLRSDKQNIQKESGAVWNAGKLRCLKSNLDMNRVDACLYNEVEESKEYNAWWYCCMPIKIIRKDNLPMPLFVRGDDIEYGLRNIKTLILMNGICIWHVPFENKYSSYVQYYVLRNMLIDNALHFPKYGKYNLKKILREQVIREILFYRYKNVDLILQAVQDFLKGVDWLLQTDAEELHKQIMDKSYKLQNIDELKMKFFYSVYKDSLKENDSPSHRIFRLMLLNGYLLPANRNNIVSADNVRPYNLYRTKKAMNYDEGSNKAFITKKSYYELFRCLKNYFKVNREIDKKFDKVKKEYRKRQKELQNIDFWEKYLMLENDELL